MESIYELIRSNLIGGEKLPNDFNILRIAAGEDYPPPDDGEDRRTTADGVTQGEFDAVVARLPKNISQHLLVNFFTAVVLKRGIKAYDEMTVGSLDGKKLDAARKIVASAVAASEKYETITIADKVLSQLVNLKTDRKKTANFGKYLATTGQSVPAVKLGIAMTGSFGDPDDEEIIMTLGRCEEFTYFAVKALSVLIKDSSAFVDRCMELVKVTGGWGKLSAILELPDKIEDGEHRRWLLTHGADSLLGLYPQAAECAVKGGLGGFLGDCIEDKTVLDAETACGICNIIEGLFQAENVKGWDAFNEVPDIGTVLSSFAYCVKCGVFQNDERAETLLAKLAEKKYIRS